MTGSLILSEYPGEIVRLSCAKCGRSYDVERERTTASFLLCSVPYRPDSFHPLLSTYGSSNQRSREGAVRAAWWGSLRLFSIVVETRRRLRLLASSMVRSNDCEP
jgi:hypothetical protein